jgi:two-component system NtrC family sensor kinase
VAIIGLVAAAILVTGSIDIYFSYYRIRDGLSLLQEEKARSAASTVSGFINDIELQLSETLREASLDETPEQRRDTLRRLLRRAPAITDTAYVDREGREVASVSRLSPDRVLSGEDRSDEEAFTGTRRGQTHYSAVAFRSDSEPYMTIGKSETGSVGDVMIANVNLTFVQEVIADLKLPGTGYAFVVDSNGLLIAHPDLTLVLQKRDLGDLPHVASALDANQASQSRPTVGTSIGETSVLTAHESVNPTGWIVFVEQPTSEAFAPLRDHILRTVVIFVAALGVAALTSILLARRLSRPIGALHQGAAAMGEGDLDYRINISTKDELEELAGEFNRMGQQLRVRLDELRASRLRLVKAQDEERRRMERDIHDGAQQQLVAISIKLGLMKSLLQKDLGRAAGMIEELKVESSDALATLRDLARGLYPPTLRDEGLVGAIEAQLARLPGEAELVDGGLRRVRFPQEIEGSVYFVIREALQNASKYAHGAPITISLSRVDGFLRFAVSDKGPGFDPETVKRGAGLQNMSDRLEALGGELLLDSAPSGGSTVGGRVPLAPREEAGESP